MKTVSYNDVLYRAAELSGRPRDKLPLSEALMLQGYLAVKLQELWNKAAWPELIPDFEQVSPDSNRSFPKNSVLGNELLGSTVSTDGSALAVVTTAQPHGMVSGEQFTIADATFSYFNVTNAVATVTDATHFTYVIPAQGSATGSVCTVQVLVEMGDILGVFTNNPKITTRFRRVIFREANEVVYIQEGLATVWVEFVLPRPDLMSFNNTQLANVTLPARFSNVLAMAAAGHLLRADSQTAWGDENLALADVALKDELNRLPAPPPWRNVSVRTEFAISHPTSVSSQFP